MKRLHVYISGRVQGVFFRAHTQEKAQSLNLGGWVRNRSDGSVEAVFEGDDQDVDAMLRWCKTGPPHAIVKDVRSVEEPASGSYNAFKISY
jgi:acylphosphatase